MAPRRLRVVAVVVTEAAVRMNRSPGATRPGRRLLCALAGLLALPSALAAVLPEDRADLMYHSYEGGGVSVEGPALLVRKRSASRSILVFMAAC